ncbi:MAG: phosphoribosylamine--glycine ligase [Ignavibacteriales bacterium]|nr:phosphoribosylamine--glycine ligase [Ignavibacteriales bacterium]
MNVLVVGSGGREHALAWKLKQSPSVKKLWCAPGNAGTDSVADNVPIKAHDLPALLKFARKESVDLTVVGPEQPLVEGIVDLFESEGLAIFGPSKAAARLEGSKVFAKEFMGRHRIPTAQFKTFRFDEYHAASDVIRSAALPIVIKADGLAAGKGVAVCSTLAEAAAALEECFVSKTFGDAGASVVIEECLEGVEASIFVLTDGDRFALLAPAQDHKRILDGDRGKNTGGMGAYAPAPCVTPVLHSRIVKEIVEPTLRGMKAEGYPFRGCLFVGLMLTADGPSVLEYNCRFGDPETQAVVPLIDGDAAELFLSVAQSRLRPNDVKLHHASAVSVVMASQGYPDAYETGKEILGLDAVNSDEGVVVFHAGTRRVGNSIVTSGGRVLGVTAIDYQHELKAAIETAYRTVSRITFDGAYYRSDIGKNAIPSRTNRSQT